MEEISDCNESISILRHNTIQKLSALLKSPKIILTDTGLPRYWKGLAELCTIERYVISSLENNPDPVKELLGLWQNKPESTVRQLVINLEKLDRYDIVDDITPLLVADIHYFKENPEAHKTQVALNPDSEKYVLTKDDAENTKPFHYNAFLLYADDDIDFATRVLYTMEKDYDFRFCVKDRDLIGGTFEHKAIVKLIEERCDRLVVILTPSFFSSPANNFFLDCAQTISIVKRQRKIIPCIYKPCPNMPPEMYCYYMLDYTKPKIWNFWNKLSDSIRTESAPQLSASNRILDRETGTRQCNDPLAITQDQKENTLKPVSPSVKFKSPVDSNNSSQLVLSEQPSESLNPSTSSNSLDSQISPEKKSKQKSNWLKKLLNKGYPTEKCGSEHITNGDSSEKCEKKRFWARQRKRKAEIAA